MSLDASDSAVPQIAGTAAPRISWVPPAGGFAGLSMLNGLLRILTLGVYHFWGKTEVRQRIWSAVRIDGEPLEYRGTGGELFRGFLVVFFLILLPMGLASFGSSLFLPTTWQGVYQMAFWGMLFLSLAYKLLLWFIRLWNANDREKCPYCGKNTLTTS